MIDKHTQLACRSLAPEDIVVGSHIAITRQTNEYPSFFWCGCDPHVLPSHEPVTITWLPWDPQPLRVRAVCLPYVVVQSPSGERDVLDVRRVSLAHLPEPVGRKMYRLLTPPEQRKRKSKRRRRKS